MQEKRRGFLKIMIFAVMALIVTCGTSDHITAVSKVWDGSVASGFAGGDGTAGNPYQIADGSQLALMAAYVNDNMSGHDTANYVLTDDISLNDTANWLNWQTTPPANSWKPMGNPRVSVWKKYGFNGVFDGKGHTIQGLYSNNAASGLFDTMCNGTIKNVKVINSVLIANEKGGMIANVEKGLVEQCSFSGKISATGSYVGGIAGYNNEATIKDCTNIGTIELGNTSFPGGANAGGIAGTSEGVITGCNNTGNITDNNQGTKYWLVGGIAGHSKEISNCYNEGTISGNKNTYALGGITAFLNGNLTNCYNKGTIVVCNSGKCVGGIAGYLYEGTISSCNNSGTIPCGNSVNDIGGVLGRCDNGSISNSFNTGNITTGKSAESIGGIMGDKSDYHSGNQITKCYNKGKITVKKSSKFVGGIIGNSDCDINASYNTGRINAPVTEYVGGISGDVTRGCITNCYNSGKICGKRSSLMGGLVGNLGALCVEDASAPNVKGMICNSHNSGAVGGIDCVKVAGIAGDSYYKSYNNYNSGKVTGSSMIGGITSRKPGNAILQTNGYWMKESVKFIKKRYKDENVSKYGTVLKKSTMASKSFVNRLNKWVKKRGNTYYKWEKSSGKKNGGFPVLKLP